MNFSLLAESDAVLPVLRAISESSRHTLPQFAAVDSVAAEVLRQMPGAQRVAHWSELLREPVSDAVIIAGESEVAQEAAKQLAAAGSALLLFPSAAQGTAFIYELSLIRDDSRCVMVPAFDLPPHPAIRLLKQKMDAGEFGPIYNLQFERQYSGAGSAPWFTAADVDAALLHDAALLQFLGGEYDQVTSLQSEAVAGQVTLARVTLAGPHLPSANWSLQSAGAGAWTLTILCGTGRIVADGNGRWHVNALVVDDQSLDFSAGTADPDECERAMGRTLLDEFEAAVNGEPPRPSWGDLVRAFEVLDAGHESIRRRRTIDLHFETASERSVFKTQMTALGCGVLMATLALVLLLLIVGAVVNIPARWMQAARLLVFLPLVLYLLLQLLLIFTRPPSRDADPNAPKNE